MERHFVSRAGAVGYLVAALDKLDRKPDEATTDGEKMNLRKQIDSLKRLVLEVRAGRVDAVGAPGLEIVIKD